MTLPLGLKLDRVERLAIRASGAASALYSTKEIVSVLPNIIEEIRVNNALMKKHRGIMRIFTMGHSRMFDRGIYGISRSEIPQASAFDKVVLFFRLGAGAGIPLGAEERELIKQIEALQNTDQSIEFAKTINPSCFRSSSNSQQISMFEDTLSSKAYTQIESLLSQKETNWGMKKTGIVFDIDRIPGIVKSILEMANSTTFVESKTESEFQRPKL